MGRERVRAIKLPYEVKAFLGFVSPYSEVDIRNENGISIVEFFFPRLEHFIFDLKWELAEELTAEIKKRKTPKAQTKRIRLPITIEDLEEWGDKVALIERILEKTAMRQFNFDFTSNPLMFLYARNVSFIYEQRPMKVLMKKKKVEAFGIPVTLPFPVRTIFETEKVSVEEGFKPPADFKLFIPLLQVLFGDAFYEDNSVCMVREWNQRGGTLVVYLAEDKNIHNLFESLLHYTWRDDTIAKLIRYGYRDFRTYFRKGKPCIICGAPTKWRNDIPMCSACKTKSTKNFYPKLCRLRKKPPHGKEPEDYTPKNLYRIFKQFCEKYPLREAFFKFKQAYPELYRKRGRPKRVR